MHTRVRRLRGETFPQSWMLKTKTCIRRLSLLFVYVCVCVYLCVGAGGRVSLGFGG